MTVRLGNLRNDCHPGNKNGGQHGLLARSNTGEQDKWPTSSSLLKMRASLQWPIPSVRCTRRESWYWYLSPRTGYCFRRIQLPWFPAGTSHRANWPFISWPLPLFRASLENAHLGVGAGSNLKTLYLSVTLSKTGSAKALWLIQVWSLYRGLCSGCDKAVAESKSINPNVFIFLNSSSVAYPWEEM